MSIVSQLSVKVLRHAKPGLPAIRGEYPGFGKRNSVCFIFLYEKIKRDPGFFDGLSGRFPKRR